MNAGLRRFPASGKTGTLCRDLCAADGLVMHAVRDKRIIAPPLTVASGRTDDHFDLAGRFSDLAARSLDMRP